MTRKEFKNRLDKLQDVITRGLAYYTVWKKLSLHDADNVTWSLDQQNQILGRFRGFFSPVAFALLDMGLVQFVKALDTDSKTASLRILLNSAMRDERLLPHVSEGDLRKISGEMRQHKQLLKNLQRMRDQKLAHADANPDPVDPLLTADFDKLVEWVKSAFNTLSVGYDQNVFSWEQALKTSERQTTEVFGILLEEMRRQQMEHDENMVRIGLNEARRAEVMLGHRLDKETLGSAIGTLGLTEEQMQRIEKEYNSEATRSVAS